MRISVVIPVHDEEECVRPLVEELLPILLGLDASGEVLLVDDGSTDGTADAIRAAQARWPRHVRHLRLPENRGQTAALDAGFRCARGDLIVTMDGDLQVDPRDIPMMVGHARDHDVVHGWRWQRKDTVYKRVQTWIANAVRNRLTRSDIRDTGCSLKVFRREVVQGMTLYTGMHRFLVNLARLEGWRTHEVRVAHRPRAAGRSKYGLWNRVFRAWRDLLAFRWMASRRYPRDVEEVPAETVEDAPPVREAVMEE